MDDAKKLSLHVFRGVHLRDTLSKKNKIKRMWYFKFDSSSGDGKHLVMWFKKGKDKFYFNSYGGQPTCKLIEYLKLLPVER